MRRADLLLCCVLLLSGATATNAQTVIDASRRIDWTQVGIPGGIPSRTTVCATLNPGASAAQINSAIASCPSGQVIFLNQGTYNLSSGLDFHNKNGVTLRGAGPDKTRLVFSGSFNCFGMGGNICVRNNELHYTSSPVHTANWTGGYTKGSTQITLSNTTGLAVGSVVILDQLNDSDTDTGAIWVCSTTNACAINGSSGGGRTNREQEQIVRVTGISGNTVTISPGLYMPNWRASQSPQAWWGDTVTKSVGIEDLSLDHANSDELSGIFFFNGYNCWVKNVKSINANRNHVWLWQTAKSIVRDSYFYGTKNSAPQSYGVESYMSSDNLVENNIFQHITASMMVNGATTGGVFAYNYVIDAYFAPGPQTMFAGDFVHGAGSDMLLHEGNDSNGIMGDVFHGTHHFLTVFRSYYTGLDPGRTSATNPVNLQAYNRYMNVVGSVLGTPGYHNNYEWSVSGSNKNTSIYALGDGTGGPPQDARVKSTLLRWGNYDTVTGTVRWNASEVPSGIGQFANPLPGTMTLPPSLYLSAKPSWWGNSIPWPPIGPDVTGGSGPGGRAHKIPARVCYDNTSKTNGILNFSAANCYGSSTSPPLTPPAAPTNVRIISTPGS